MNDTHYSIVAVNRWFCPITLKLATEISLTSTLCHAYAVRIMSTRLSFWCCCAKSYFGWSYLIISVACWVLTTFQSCRILGELELLCLLYFLYFAIYMYSYLSFLACCQKPFHRLLSAVPAQCSYDLNILNEQLFAKASIWSLSAGFGATYLPHGFHFYGELYESLLMRFQFVFVSSK